MVNKHSIVNALLILGNFWITFAYYGIQTVLVLYLNHVFHFSNQDSILLYGAYVAIIYTMPILGGIAADQVLGIKMALLLGLGLTVLGNIIMLSYHYYCFTLGLTLFIVGMGFFKSSSSRLLGILQELKVAKANKELTYTILYLTINVGGSLSPLLYSLAIYYHDWNICFLMNGIGLLITLIALLPFLHFIKLNEPIFAFSRKVSFLGLIGLLIFFLSVLLNTLWLITPIILLLFLLALIYLGWIVFQHYQQERKHIVAILILCFLGMIYYTAAFQIGITITLFISNKIQTGIIHTKLSANAFSALYCAFVIFSAPLLNYLWKYYEKRQCPISIIHKFNFGLICASLGIFCFALAASLPYVISFILFGIFLLGMGELAITPIMLATISDIAPKNVTSIMMGAWYLFMAFGGYLSSLLANGSHLVINHFHLETHYYANSFLLIASFITLITLVAFGFNKKITHLIE
ncbi:MAG: oligopeptide:H+ symporter [Legionellales bacterium]|nr:oligopeptide:H+ symporter [Legionellales bacterium]